MLGLFQVHQLARSRLAEGDHDGQRLGHAHADIGDLDDVVGATARGRGQAPDLDGHVGVALFLGADLPVCETQRGQVVRRLIETTVVGALPFDEEARDVRVELALECVPDGRSPDSRAAGDSEDPGRAARARAP